MSSFFIFSLFFQNIIEMKEGRSKGLSGKLQNLLQILAPIYVVWYKVLIYDIILTIRVCIIEKQLTTTINIDIINI